MKRTILLLLTTAALAQNARVQSADPQPIAVPSHVQHATARDIQPAGGTTMAQGERPLAEMPKAARPAPTPLGDIARQCRAAHAATPKAAKVYSNQ